MLSLTIEVPEEDIHPVGTNAVKLILAGGVALVVVGVLKAGVTRLSSSVPFRDLIERWAAARDLDPCLVAGLIKQESDFRVDQVGDDGRSIGLMQIQVATAADFLPAITRDALFDPDKNIEGGTAFLAWLKRNGVPFPNGVSAYNTGLAGWRAGNTPNPPNYSQRVIGFSKELCDGSV